MKPQLPENLRHCEPLKVFEGEAFADVLLYTVALAHQYKDCEAKSEAKNSYFETP